MMAFNKLMQSQKIEQTQLTKQYVDVPVRIIYNMIGRFMSNEEKHSCNFNENQKMLKNALLFCLLLYFQADGKGIVCYRNLDGFAKEIGCCKKTIKRCIKKLKEAGTIQELADVDHKGEPWGKYSIGRQHRLQIVGHDQKHKEPKGYIQMNREQFEELKKSENIHELRVSLRALTDTSLPSPLMHVRTFNEFREFVGPHVSKEELRKMLRSLRVVFCALPEGEEDHKPVLFGKGEINLGRDTKKSLQEDADWISDNIVDLANAIEEGDASRVSDIRRVMESSGFLGEHGLDRVRAFHALNCRKAPSFTALSGLSKDIMILLNQFGIRAVKAAIHEFFARIMPASDYSADKKVAIYLRGILTKLPSLA